MKDKEIEVLLECYFDGNTSLEEEKVLNEYFKGEVPAHLEKYKPMFASFSEAKIQKFNNTDLFSKIKEEENKSETIAFYKSKNTEWFYKIAASIVLVIIGFSGGIVFSKYGGASGEGEITALRNDMKEMKQMMLLTQLNQTSPSERLQAINTSYEIAEANQTVIDALISTMNTDKNVNVRLAAAQALVRFKDDKKVKEAMLQSLKLQDNPIMQITLIDLLVELQEKSAVYELQVLLQNDQLMEMVKQKAQNGISQLQSI